MTSEEKARRRMLAMHVKRSETCLGTLLFLNLMPTRGKAIAGRKVNSPIENRVSNVSF
jgi:hypothetical protein